MKRAISILLVLVICLSLCACGVSKDRVRDDIIDKRWRGSIKPDSQGHEYIIRFSYASTASVHWYTWTDVGFSYSDDWEGPYTIERDRIIISDGGKDFFIYYTYRNGEINLTLKEDGKEIPLEVMPANAI